MRIDTTMLCHILWYVIIDVTTHCNDVSTKKVKMFKLHNDSFVTKFFTDCVIPNDSDNRINN